MTVPQHLVEEALLTIIQQTHCIMTKWLVFANLELAGSSSSKKYGLATFVHERLNWTLCIQSSSSSDTEWLCGMLMDIKSSTSTGVHQHDSKHLIFYSSLTLVLTLVILTNYTLIGDIIITVLTEIA